MADAAHSILQDQIADGIVITKYGHSKGPIGNLVIMESGHPIPDDNSYRAAEYVIEFVSSLTADDTVLFLVSGGGSALFEKPLVSPEEFEDITTQLLRSGASIQEINTIRKRLSAVKGGRFAELCYPANIFSIVLSDIIGNPLDMIASGPAYPDASTTEDALRIIDKYKIKLSDLGYAALIRPLPKTLNHVETVITGSVDQLCYAAAEVCSELGIKSQILTTSLTCTAKDAGSFLASIAQHHKSTTEPLAFICGGETVVNVTGTGLGGRNQELALAAAPGISGIHHAAVFSVGSDGTDGPTDAAGGYVDGFSLQKLEEQNCSVGRILAENDAYHALEIISGLIKTGPTGTNVNDLSVLLIDAVQQ